jgi:hypothetical protein
MKSHSGILVLTRVTFLVCMLTGCASAYVDTSSIGGQGLQGGDATYQFHRAAWQEKSSTQARIEALLKAELEKHALREVRGADARPRYILSIAWDARPSEVRAQEPAYNEGMDACTDASVTHSNVASVRGGYLHELVLTVFDHGTGREIYRVTAVFCDRDAELGHAVAFLVKGALARFPYTGTHAWRVKLRPAENPRATADVIAVEALGR